MHDEPTPGPPADDMPGSAGGASADSSTVEALGVELTAAADRVVVGDPATMLTAVRTTATRRRRRRNTVVGLAAAGTLVASGAIVANLVDGNSGDDLIVSAPATEPATTEPAEPAEVDTPPATVVADAPGDITEVVATDEAIPVRLVPADVNDVVDAELSIDAAATGQMRLLRWQDGFLSIRTTYDPQPLPTELPQEIVDQFPPEVVELFPDGLPATITEATQVLQDAGLLDEVSAVITANQEVYDAIYAEQGAVQTTVRFSSDGVEWSDVDADFPVPDNQWGEVRTTSDRFVIVVNPGGGAPFPDSAGDAQNAEVYSSTDLVTWEVQQIPLPVPPTDLGPAERYMPYLNSVAVTDDGFVASIQVSVDVDPMNLVDAETRERANSSGGGFGVSYGDEGVTIELYGIDAAAGPVAVEDAPPVQPTVTETLTYTWEELGLDGAPNQNEESVTWASTWGGVPARVDLSETSWVVGVGDEFVELGQAPRRSVDGVDWVPIELPTEGYIEAIIETSDGVALRMSGGPGGSATYTGDLSTGEWTAIDTANLPENAYSDQAGHGAFLLADYGDEGGDPYADSIGSRQRAEVDGYVYELEVTHGLDVYSVTYTLTDLASGEVVVSESADGLSTGEDPFEFVQQDEFGGSSITIVDPDSGEPLVSIPYEAMTQEIINADGTVTDVSETAVDDAEPSTPRHWVMAPVGDGWILEQITDGSENGFEEGRWPAGVVAVDDVVLVGWSDGTFTRIAPA